MRIRKFDLDSDRGFLRRCVVELQETERRCDPRLPSGAAMVEPYCARLLERCREWCGVLFVAEVEQPAGLLSLFLQVPETEPDEPGGSYALISDLVVLPQARGRGIGAALLAHAETYAQAAGAEVLRLEVMAGNRTARQFYGRYDWRERLVQLEKPLSGTSRAEAVEDCSLPSRGW